MTTRKRTGWATADLFDIARAIKPCSELRMGGYVRPCSISECKTEDMWCENCKAWRALQKIDNEYRVMAKAKKKESK